MNWDRLRIFHAVAEAGSLTHAGQRLRLSQPAISRQVTALESDLKSTLFHRHARGLVLTEAGETLYQTTSLVFRHIQEAETRLTEMRDRPVGALKITAGTAFGATWLTERIRAFLELYPDIDAKLILTDQELDLGMREADCAIRIIPPHHPGLVQRKIATFSFHLYAASDYIDRMGLPRTPEDLAKLDLIYCEEAPELAVSHRNWLQTLVPKGHPPRLIVNNLYGAYRAVRSGLGVASLPNYMVGNMNNLGLCRLFPDLTGPETSVYFVYPEELRGSKRIDVFRTFLLTHLEQSPP